MNHIFFKNGRGKVYPNKNIHLLLQKNSVKLLCLLCFLLVNIYLILYLKPFNCPILGHDSGYHYLRVEALKYNIENFNLFSGIDYIFFNGGGYASFAYPDIFLYIPAILRVFGVGIGMSMTIFIVLCNVFSYYFMFIFLKKVSGSPICGTIGAVLYVLSSYRIDNIIARFALGEVQAYVFWPLILYGIYDFIFDQFKKPYILGFGFIGMFLSHSISTAMAFALSFLLSIVFIKRILQTPKKLITLAITAVCVIAVTAYYWIPLLELFSSCEMTVKEPAFHSGDHTIKTTDVFRDISITGLGFPIFLLCTLRLFLTKKSPVYQSCLQNEIIKKKKNILIAADAFMIIGIIVSLIPTKLAPWKILSKPLDFMQFPWRLFAVASVLLITAGTIYLFYITKFTKAPKASIILITAFAILCAFVHTDGTGINHNYELDPNHYSIETEATFNVSKGEWMPRATQGNGIDTIKELGDNVLLSNNTKVQCERENGELKFTLDNNEDIEFAKLPYVWYKGYEATDENGNKLEVSMSDNGLVQVDLHDVNGEIIVKHKTTSARTISYGVSIISILSIFLFFTLSLKRKREFGTKDMKDNHDIKKVIQESN